MQARHLMEHDLRNALPAGEFELHYQPVVNLESNEISGVEALIRWRHPEKGIVPPSAFIPVAEEIGFIVPLGEWVIRQACATAAKWPGDVRIAVNLSPIQFRNPGFVQVVVGALAASGLAADRLELEITESTLLQDSEATLSTLYQLRALGVRIAMDDFGTGYSSLSYLQSFPFDKIKIDRSFVKDIVDGVGSLNIVRAVAAMANGLGMATTAEGVETKEQLETVKAEGCTEMQGFLFSRPVPAEEIEALLLDKCKAQGERRKLRRLRRLTVVPWRRRSGGDVLRGLVGVGLRRAAQQARPDRPTEPGCAPQRDRHPPCCGRWRRPRPGRRRARRRRRRPCRAEPWPAVPSP